MGIFQTFFDRIRSFSRDRNRSVTSISVPSVQGPFDEELKKFIDSHFCPSVGNHEQVPHFRKDMLDSERKGFINDAVLTLNLVVKGFNKNGSSSPTFFDEKLSDRFLEFLRTGVRGLEGDVDGMDITIHPEKSVKNSCIDEDSSGDGLRLTPPNFGNMLPVAECEPRIKRQKRRDRSCRDFDEDDSTFIPPINGSEYNEKEIHLITDSIKNQAVVILNHESDIDNMTGKDKHPRVYVCHTPTFWDSPMESSKERMLMKDDDDFHLNSYLTDRYFSDCAMYSQFFAMVTGVKPRIDRDGNAYLNSTGTYHLIEKVDSRDWRKFYDPPVYYDRPNKRWYTFGLF